MKLYPANCHARCFNLANTPVLNDFCSFLVFIYILVYIAIIRFKVPHWLRRS